MTADNAETSADITPVALQPFTFPLHGRRLIEASAGTGKTWTIASLYLRLVLGHGESVDGLPTAYPEPLSVDRILVVTFTEAATAELRERIRVRLHEARLAFMKGSSNDPYIQSLLKSLDQHPERAKLLLAAERQMDEASVFTIHGFCQRMLKQHAFESGTLFSSDLVTDETELLQQAAADFWRQYLYPLSRPLTELVLELWNSPADLLKSIRSWLGLSGLKTDAPGLPASLEEFEQTHVQPVMKLKEHWLKEHQNIYSALEKARVHKGRKPWKRLNDVTEFASGDKPQSGTWRHQGQT